MPLFNISTKAVSAVVQEIADSAGVSADVEMTTRAGRSLNAGIEYLNTRANWDFLLTEAPMTTLVAPFAVTGVSASAGQTSAAVPAGHGILVDDLVQGIGFNAGIRISATAAGAIGIDSTLNAQLTASPGPQVVTATLLRDMYALPSDFKQFYSDRLQGPGSSPRVVRRRLLNRSVISEFSPSTPVAYDPFPVPQKGKFQLRPVPSQADMYRLTYYRRMTVPTATAATEALDILQDYEPFLIAWTKWHFLTDKGEGRADQAAVWLAFAKDGILTMLRDQAVLPDEDLLMIPGHYTYNPAWGPNSVRWQLDQAW